MKHRLLLDSDISLPLVDDNKAASYHGAGADFGGNMVIILAALLCALICALGLSSFLRWTRRCTRAFADETGGDGAASFRSAAAADEGMKKVELSRIPAVVYESGLRIPATDCPICLGEFAEGDDVRILPRCSHGFHIKCIDTWLAIHCSCPTCRQPLTEHSPASQSVVVGVQIA